MLHHCVEVDDLVPEFLVIEHDRNRWRFPRLAQREDLEQFVERAKAATASGAFAAEITPVTVKTRAGDVLVSVDEGPGKARLDKIPSLKPAFKKDGTITAANASSISDGAAALVLMRESTARQLGATPIARIAAHAVHAQAPEWFTTAPTGAIEALPLQSLEYIPAYRTPAGTGTGLCFAVWQ